MEIEIKRVDKSLPLPTYERGASCFDFVCREDVQIKPNEIGLIPTNAIVKVPDNYTLLVFSRSSTPLKKGLMLANGVGVIDSFFCGDSDEIMVEFFNITNKLVKIARGEVLAQGLLVKYEQGVWKEVEKMGSLGRGGF